MRRLKLAATDIFYPHARLVQKISRVLSEKLRVISERCAPIWEVGLPVAGAPNGGCYAESSSEVIGFTGGADATLTSV